MRQIANEYARERDKREAMRKIQTSDAWNDVGSLKRDLIEFWLAERNRYSKEVVEDIRKQEGKPTWEPGRGLSMRALAP